jgi:hypothetical protein
MPEQHNTTTTTTMARRIMAAAVAVTTLMVWFAPVTVADAQSAVIGLVILHADEGSTSELARFDVDPELVGLTCELTASVDNQRSVNIGNDVYVSTGGSQLVLTDVEALAGHVTSATSTVVAGATVAFTLHMGPGKVFSGKLMMNLDCETPTDVTTTTTAQPTTTSTTVQPTTTTAQATTTTAQATTTTAGPAPSLTEVLGEVATAPPAQPVVGQPTFTG